MRKERKEENEERNGLSYDCFRFYSFRRKGGKDWRKFDRNFDGKDGVVLV